LATVDPTKRNLTKFLHQSKGVQLSAQLTHSTTRFNKMWSTFSKWVLSTLRHMQLLFRFLTIFIHTNYCMGFQPSL